MRSSLRTKLLITFLALVVIVGAATLIAIEQTLSSDLVSSLDARMTKQAKALADWLASTDDPNRVARPLADVTDTRITLIGPDGTVVADSHDRDTIGKPIGEAHEVTQARHGERGRAIRRLRADEPPQYLVALPAAGDRVIRLAVPLGDIEESRAGMRRRLLVGSAAGLVGLLLLSWIFTRAITRPLKSMTRAAEKLAKGDYDAPPPPDPGGELGVLSRAIVNLAGQVKARVSDLTQQRDLLRVVFGGLVEGVVVVDRSGSIVLVNDAAEPLIDPTPSTSMSMPRSTDEPHRLPPPLMALVDRALAGEQADKELELHGRHVRASARPLGDPGAIVVLYDVTRMRALEAVRREFLSNAAHELRTPVTSIAGYAETLLGGEVDVDTSKEFLQTIHRNADRISHLVSDLVLLDTLGGRQSVVEARSTVAIAQVVRDAVRTAKGVTPNADIDVDVPDDLNVLGTRDGLDHVVQNLIDNAIKYGNDTQVTVRTERVGDQLRVAIADRGPGIPKGFEERIFERFYRIDRGRSRDKGGSGLGLAIVKSQIEAMGGRIWVEDAKPGARFVIELDLA
ncbi:MAG TPA: ATP-binding protein [Kofleriaceae bacterium]|nr:ATP-binding protein [Kofleriaceae bacterium]